MKQISNAIRFLSVDMVEAAKSGHPGMPMGMSDFFSVLYKDFLQFHPKDPKWPNRDRLILSAGHGSALLYSALFLTGYSEFSMEELQNFRQLNSKTPGHPEYDIDLGIETTTGPLGQGIANAVGMSISENILRAKLGKEVINHKIYAVVGDGCLMEGISYEAISLAGHLQLSNLIVIFDDNEISIDGKTSLATSQNHKQLFLANNWVVLEIDGHNFPSIYKSLNDAQNSTSPVLIICKTKIGYGSVNKEGKESAHGAPLGEKEVKLTRENLGWNQASFELPEELLQQWRSFWERNSNEYEAWQKDSRIKFEKFQKQSNLTSAIKALGDLKIQYKNQESQEATRKSSGKAIDAILQHYPSLLGGSADLSLSNCTLQKDHQPINSDDMRGNYIHYGVREHLMAAAMNGISLHGSFKPYGGTFLVFSDYCKPAIRLAAMMKLGVVFVMTHDSIGLGEDGPTHQPIEHLAMLRSISNLLVFRPSDGAEVAEAWQIALSSKKSPVVISLSRQDLPQIREENDFNQDNKSANGGYVIKKESHPHQYTLVSTGSEVQIAIEVAKKFEQKGVGARVVSAPCRELFLQQKKEYINLTLGNPDKIFVIEAGIQLGWEKIIGKDGFFFGMNSFGMSGKACDLYEYFELTPNKIFNKIAKNHKTEMK